MRYLVLVLACGLEACTSGAASVSAQSGDARSLSQDMDRRCRSIAAGSSATFQAPSCPDCAADRPENSIDGADATFTTITAPTDSVGPLSLRAVAPAGVVYPAGSNAAVTLSATPGERDVPAGSSSLTIQPGDQRWHLTLTTYLGGFLQDQDVEDVTLQDGAHWRGIILTTTTQPFDSIEIAFDRVPAQVGGTSVDISPQAMDYVVPGEAEVHEFCADFDPSGLSGG